MEPPIAGSQPAASGSRLRRVAGLVSASNILGLAAMLAYSALLALVPLVLLALFVVSVVLESAGARASLLGDLQAIFPSAAQETLLSALGNVKGAKVSLGLGAILGGLLTGVGLLSTLDTAFRAVYNYPARSWVEQKRWALKTLGLALVLLLGLLAVPAVHAVIAGGVASLPLGLDVVGPLLVALASILSHGVLFLALCAVYHAVPPGRPAWRAIWPGAALTVASLSATSLVFPLYLARVSTLAHAGAAFSFIVVVLLWFYAISVALLLGACVNAERLQTQQPGAG